MLIMSRYSFCWSCVDISVRRIQSCVTHKWQGFCKHTVFCQTIMVRPHITIININLFLPTLIIIIIRFQWMWFYIWHLLTNRLRHDFKFPSKIAYSDVLHGFLKKLKIGSMHKLMTTSSFENLENVGIAFRPAAVTLQKYPYTCGIQQLVPGL